MLTTSLLLLSFIVSAPVVNQGVQPAVSAPLAASAETPEIVSPQSFLIKPASTNDDNSFTPSDDVCYKIRAYVFKRDDDHAPGLVRSTTCQPSKTHLDKAEWPEARIAPAN
jgi:hypothetical protein